MESEGTLSSIQLTTEIKTLDESNMPPITKRAYLNLKTIMTFAALGDSKKGKASLVSEPARQLGVCYVLLFSMLPPSQSTLSFNLTQDRSDLID